MIQFGKIICFGMDPRWATLPITNLPVDTIRVRRCLRAQREAVAFVLQPGRLTKWMLEPDEDLTSCRGVRLGELLAENIRQPSTQPAEAGTPNAL